MRNTIITHFEKESLRNFENNRKEVPKSSFILVIIGTNSKTYNTLSPVQCFGVSTLTTKAPFPLPGFSTCSCSPLSFPAESAKLLFSLQKTKDDQ